MGLDISVKKPVMPTAENIEASKDWENEIYEYIVSGIEGSSELAVFSDFLFKKNIVYNDLEATFNSLNLDYTDYHCESIGNPVSSNHEEFDFYWTYVNINTKEYLLIKNSEIITFEKEEDCILVSEVGYQRKGANKEFYDDGMWGSKCILDKITLDEHLVKYFSSGEDKGANFKKNIINNFVTGETFVLYH